MKFNSARIEREWSDPKLHPVVKRIVTDAAAFALERFGWEFTITCIYRTPAEDAALKASGVHVAWRGIDARTRDRPQSEVDDVARYINARWQYDPQRPSMLVCFTEKHGTGPHAHFQSHVRTIERTP